jgi:uncharacterized protein (DUF433 family)
VDSHTCFGKPRIRGTSLWVSLLLDLMASGESMESILESYPGLTHEDLQAALAYGAAMSSERFIELPSQPAAGNSNWMKT